MRKLLIVYIALISAYMIYAYNYHFKQESAGPWGERGLHGDMSETYVMVTFQSGMDYWKSILKGFEDAAQALNVSIEYRGATHYDVDEQIMVLEQVIAKKPAGIAISTIDPYELTDTINKAIDADISVVLFDSGAVDSNAYSFLGTNNYQSGVTAAHVMSQLIDGEGEVAVITHPSQLNHQERTDGFRETIRREYPAIQVVVIEDGKGDRLISREKAIKILNEYPAISGIFATEANGGVGIGEAVQFQEKLDKVHIISFDTDKQTLDLIEDGTIYATLAQGTWNMGYWSLQFLFHLNHDLTEPPILPSSEVSPIPTYVDTGITVVTKENVENYYAQ